WVLAVLVLLIAAAVTIVGARLLVNDVAPTLRPSPSLVALAPSGKPDVSPSAKPSPSAPPAPTGGRPILAYTDDRSVIGPVQVILIDAATGDRTVLGTLPGKQPGTHVPRYSFVRVGQDVVIVAGEADQPTTQLAALPDAGPASAFRPARDLLAACCPKDSFDQPWSPSPDGTRITGTRFDERGVEPRPLDVLFSNLDGTNRVRSPFPTGVGGVLGSSSWAP